MSEDQQRAEFESAFAALVAAHQTFDRVSERVWLPYSFCSCGFVARGETRREVIEQLKGHECPEARP